MRFVFVHGGFHAAWCWERTIAELEGLGHEGIAVELPGHGARLDEESTLANRRDAIVSALRPSDVLVGHSGGRFDATLAAADVGEMLGYLKFDDDGAMWFADFEGAWRYFYHDCDEATARWAFERLGPERFGDTTVTPVSLPAFWAADLPRSFIRCLQDQSMPQ
jgi:pimeloyl-ACP methyl ester carboxylesterase